MTSKVFKNSRRIYSNSCIINTWQTIPVFQCLAVHEALQTTRELDGVKFIDKLIEKMRIVEQPGEDEYVPWVAL